MRYRDKALVRIRSKHCGHFPNSSKLDSLIATKELRASIFLNEIDFVLSSNHFFLVDIRCMFFGTVFHNVMPPSLQTVLLKLRPLSFPVPLENNRERRDNRELQNGT